MWDNVKLLDNITAALVAVAVLLAAWGAVHTMVRSPAFPLRHIQIKGDLAHVTRNDVVNALQGRLSGSFFSMDLSEVRDIFEGLPWVRRAEVRRLWPDRLEIRIEEHQALARWGQPADGRLVNTHGEVFAGTTEADLAVLSGPPGTEAEVTGRYGAFRAALAPLALEPRQVALSPRYSWQVKLSNGLTVQLGREGERDAVATRLARFVTMYPQSLAPLSRRLDYVDMRYPNGFALRVPGLAQTDAASNKAAPRTPSTNAPKSAPKSAPKNVIKAASQRSGANMGRA